MEVFLKQTGDNTPLPDLKEKTRKEKKEKGVFRQIYSKGLIGLFQG